MKKKYVIGMSALVVLGVAGFLVLNGSSSKDDQQLPKVKVQRSTIEDKALAVGTIEPEVEISIKSKISGKVNRIFAEVGDFVRAGEPLIEVKPDPTPLELAEAKRQLQLADVELDRLQKEKLRQDALRNQNLISAQDYEEFQRRYSEAELRQKLALEKLALIESGKVRIGDTQIESIIKAPIDGYVISRAIEIGDPVTPLTSYQEGTVLMKMANMERWIFKGTVDEIDVGRLKEGLQTEIKVGALPNDTIHGTLKKIWLKAEKKENSTVFPIEILVPKISNVVLRAGYSANANIIVQRKTGVLSLPERVVTFRNDSAFVQTVDSGGKSREQLIKTGLSDAIKIEVLAGLHEGQEVFEKPVKKIE